MPNIPAASRAREARKATKRRTRPADSPSGVREEDALDLSAGESLSNVNESEPGRASEDATAEEATEDRTAHASRLTDRPDQFSGGLDVRA